MSAQLDAAPPCPRSADLAYDAALRPHLWQSFVAALSDECGGAAVSLMLGVGRGGRSCRSHQHGLDADFARYWWLGAAPAYVDRPAEPGSRPRRFRFAREFRIGTEPSAIAFYRNEMKPRQLAAAAPIIADFSRGTQRAGLAIFQQVGHRPLGMDDLRRSEAVGSHLSRALEIYRRMQAECERGLSITEVLDSYPQGVLLLDAEGECVYSNASALGLVALEDGLRLRNRRLRIDDDRSHREFETARVQVERENGDANASARHLSVIRPSGALAFQLAVKAISKGRGRPGAARVAVFVSDPEATADPELLRSLYGLTRAEAALASLLAAGYSLRNCAERRRIGVGTARSYLKALYRKTRTHSQRELVELVLTGLSPLASRRSEKKLAEIRV